MAPADQERTCAVVLAVQRSPALRCLVGAPITLQDLPLLAQHLEARVFGREAPPLPQLGAGDGQPPPPSAWQQLRRSGAIVALQQGEDP